MPRYNPKTVEPKWQDHWLKNKSFKAEMTPAKDAKGELKPKYYALDMFPYPSANGLHVGHPEGYTATDIVCRYKRMRGFNVLHPMGWDAFGLPAEQHAIKTGTHPAVTTQSNINNFRRQIRALGFSYDWDREISTTDQGYFKWTQWIFKQLFESFYDPIADKAKPIGQLPIPPEYQEETEIRRYRDSQRLAYISENPVWWCQELGTVLANEEVSDGKSERGAFPCVRRPMRQWVLRITAYAERLIRDLDGLDWPDSIKAMQKNWIGKSTGAEVRFQVEGQAEPLVVFTTRPDTLFGATYMVVAPEHPILDAITTGDRKAAVDAYRKAAGSKSDLERGLDKEKTGVDTGVSAINPVTGKRIPIWTSDYVMMGYGTGAIMAVPAHDDRDFAFAKAFGLPIVEVIQGGDVSKEAWTGDGLLVNSGFLDGLKVDDSKAKIIAWLEEKALGKARVQFKLRDWLFSRQRYWGEPFPLVHTAKGVESIPDSELPVTLPEMEDYKPTGTFEPPLAKAKEWSDYKGHPGDLGGPGCAPGRRELNTMPQWAGSSWYFLRFLDSKNDKEPWSKEAEKYWMPVDLYIGGAEHAVLHLLYSRFWHKVMFDLGHVSMSEPFHKLVNQGLILGEDGEKMSKSSGNVVNPDDVIERYGADSMRLYEMFMGPLERQKPWQTAGIEGLWRFLNKVWRATVGDDRTQVNISNGPPPTHLVKKAHQTIKKVTEDIEGLRFNTAISQMMIFVGDLGEDLEKSGVAYRETSEILIKLVAPFAPHIAEEIWETFGHNQSLTYEPWPVHQEALTVEDTINVVFQTNGKVRVEHSVPKGTTKEEMEAMARSHPKFMPYLESGEVIKVIAVPGKLVNFVLKPK
ncbi:MAG: leucine--tRNA ligase [Fibrobacterota bacterium]|nr:leucine--tRNA ligase [Fibrobacterota bacterium]